MTKSQMPQSAKQPPPGPPHTCTSSAHLRLCPQLSQAQESGGWPLPAASALPLSTEFRPSIDFPALPTAQHITALCKVSVLWAQLITPNGSWARVSASRKISSLLCPVVTHLFHHLLDGDLVHLGASFALPMK